MVVVITNGMQWVMKHPTMKLDDLGFLPFFLADSDPRTAREQLDANYAHGGGWCAFPGFVMLPNGDIQYPGDPPIKLLAETKLRDEIIRFFEHEWVAIIQPDGSFEICRMD